MQTCTLTILVLHFMEILDMARTEEVATVVEIIKAVARADTSNSRINHHHSFKIGVILGAMVDRGVE